MKSRLTKIVAGLAAVAALALGGVALVAKIEKDDLAVLAGLLEAGTVKPVIDRRYELSEASDALRYLGEGHARGKVVITVHHG